LNVAENFTVIASGGRVRLDRTSAPSFILDIGTTENLVINADAGDDQVLVANGNLAPLISITVHGGAGSDGITGGIGADFLFGDANDDGLNGGAGNDRLDGGPGADDLLGGADNDIYILGSEASGNDDVIDSSGIDTIISNIDRSLGFSGYSEIENLILIGGSIGIGNTLANTITGNAATNTLTGGDASDTYLINSPVDVVVEVAGTAAGTLDHVIFNGLANQSYLLAANVERLTLGGAATTRGTGNALNNLMTGNAAANILDGKQGKDNLNGAAGNDTLIGGTGVDRLTGGASRDYFVLNAPLSGAHRDVVVDFNHVADTFRMENKVMSKLGGAGALDAHFFFAGAKAHDDDDRVIYNKVNGALFYDSNGDDDGGVTLLATLINKPTLTAGDFVVI
jgi:Ca2+-binding RTX toxin-like protein